MFANFILKQWPLFFVANLRYLPIVNDIIFQLPNYKSIILYVTYTHIHLI